MGMFDEYTPVPAIDCPRCGKKLSGWQGKDGPCRLLHWKQGQANATTDSDNKFAPAEVLEAARLPSEFSIYTQCASCGKPVDATGFVEDGVWIGLTPERTVWATPERVFPDEAGRRRCGSCQTVWVHDPMLPIAHCPVCGVRTRLG